jgi:SiaC family regulatory phosphoprotein
MKITVIPDTDKTPAITFDDDNKIFEIKGMCLPENILEFNQHVIKILENYLHDFVFKTESNSINEPFKINFKLGYFNSSATKFIANVLMLANGYIQKEGNIKINWYFQENDHDMLESGQDMSRMIEIPMNFIKISSLEEDQL